jgi:hypothetical protein
MRNAAFYRSEAARYREMAMASDAVTATSRRMLADGFVQEADRLEPPDAPPIPAVLAGFAVDPIAREKGGARPPSPS